MSIDANPQTDRELTPVLPNNNTNNTKANIDANTKPTLRRAPSIAEQIAQGWRALPEEGRQRWKAATNAARAAEPARKPVYLHLKPRPLPTDQELFIDELLATEPNHPAEIVDGKARLVDDSDSSLTLLSLTVGRTIPHPWRIPGAFSDGLESIPLLAPVVPEDEYEYDEEEAKRYCMTFEAEQHFQAFEAHLLANRKSAIEIARDAAMDEWVAINQKRQKLRKGARVIQWWEYRLARRLRTSSGIPLKFHTWWWV